MSIFEFEDYKDFVREKLESKGRRGYGQYSRVAEALNIHTSMVSQIFQGPKHLTFEQACGLCAFLGLNELESDYLIALVQLERAGHTLAQEKCRRDLQKIKQQAESLKERLSSDRELTEEDNVLFYSHWYYTAIKLLTSIQKFQNAEAIAEELKLPLAVVHKTLDFLLKSGLCIEVDSKIKPGVANTHLGADSPMVARHHQNWRVKGFEKMHALTASELFVTVPATLSEKDLMKVRQKIVQAVEEIVGIIDHSKGETLYCMNVDWFKC